MAIRIGIPTPTSADLDYNRRNEAQYADAVRQAGGQSVTVPLSSSADWMELARTCDGFILPGSPADVDPALYGQVQEERTSTADPVRENCDALLLEHASESGKPVLAICFGMQRLNVWRGGTLLQDLRPVPVNHEAGPSVATAHSAMVVSQSLLAGLVHGAEATAEGIYRRLPVNSSHHQAVALPGDDLMAVAQCGQDGVIEAIEGRVGDATMIGVQWHPERSTAISATSRALFVWLVAEAEDVQMRSSEGSSVHAD